MQSPTHKRTEARLWTPGFRVVEFERAFMIEALSLVARAKYGADKFGIDDVMRQIPDHCHMHARPIRRWQY